MAIDSQVLWSVVLMEGTWMVELQQAGTFLSAERTPSPEKVEAPVDSDGTCEERDPVLSIVSKSSCRDGSLPTGTILLNSFEMSKFRPTVLHAGSSRKDRGRVAPVERSLTWIAVDSEAAESLIGKWLAWSRGEAPCDAREKEVEGQGNHLGCFA
ncbi:hypothetical protein GLAREA_10688 [Glarea lozoyensis ATCC 20868]|uniref:Uncharacterized protein n=1 Tax=Glarea lozoyensis (strain ATCC 20868 / MF5171) TaxID=1116229 RepID=S3E9K3_GLAL2|nr:uncharacterized protein GLAREA_10688 [Glarea lozoyensis ATCC 20868]EPE34993.1 hypothetical protein GLAREA_10688 [Glarea lozoyensis ATCC 20868]